MLKAHKVPKKLATKFTCAKLKNELYNQDFHCLPFIYEFQYDVARMKLFFKFLQV